MKKDISLDCFGMLCPIPIIKISAKLGEMKKGEVLEVIATDEGIKEDAAAWCRATGHKFLGVEEEKGNPAIIRAYIEK